MPNFSRDDFEVVWNRHYNRIARGRERAHSSNVFVGFNANIDAVIYLDESFESILVENGIVGLLKSTPKKELKKIRTKNEFLLALLESAINSREEEIATGNKKLVEWVEDTFKISEYRIGGQAGIMSKFLDALGLRVVFSTPKISKKMAEILPDTLIIPEEDGLKKIASAKKSKDTKTNYIFEYKKGFSVFGKKAPRSDRFILATRPKGLEPRFHQKTSYKFFSFFELVDRAIISGFQALEATDGRVFEKVHSQLEKIKKTNPDIKIHVEEAYVTDNRVSDDILEFIIRHVHSLGLNEVELAKALFAFGRDGLAKKIEKSNYSLPECYLGARCLFEQMKLERLHLHMYNYCFVLLSRKYGSSPEKVRDGLLFSLLCAAVKAEKGSVSSIDEIKHAKAEINMSGFLEIRKARKEFALCPGFLESGIADMGDHFLVVVPTKIASKLKSTVGLGDVVSSSAFVYDIL